MRFGTHAVDGLEYTYHLTFAPVPAGIAWRAIVRDGAGALTATPRGLLRGLDERAPDLDARLHAEVARTIETR